MNSSSKQDLPGDPPEPEDRTEARRRHRAEVLFRRAFELQQSGEIERAIELYRRSLESNPTAEAHTFLGWALSADGCLEEAIAECRLAIELDPAFGNPWNDIGAYLVELGRPADAIEYFEKAAIAPRYDNPEFPHMNLARVHRMFGRLGRAWEHLETAATLAPGSPEVEEMMADFQWDVN